MTFEHSMYHIGNQHHQMWFQCQYTYEDGRRVGTYAPRLWFEEIEHDW